MSLAEGLRLKPGRFLVYPCAGIWNLPNFARARVGHKSIRPEMSCAEGLGLKPDGFLGISLLGNGKSGGFLAGTCVEI